MVLPPPAPAPPPVPAALKRLGATLGLARERALVLVRVADAAGLRPIFRVLREDTPDAVFAPTGAAALSLPSGSTALLWLRRDDLAGLNLGRELFRERSLRVVVAATEDVAAALRDDAPDLYDWMAQRLDLTAEPPGWAVDTVRAVLAMGVRLAWVGERAPETTLRAARDWPVHRASAAGAWDELKRAAAAPGWRIWEGVRGPWDEARVRFAEAVMRAEGGPVLERPAFDPPGWWRVHADTVELDRAAERAKPSSAAEWAALIDTGFEPEALEIGEREEPAAWAADVPGERRALACRPMGPAIRALDPATFAAERRAEAARVARDVAEGRWPALGLVPTIADAEVDEGTLAAGILRFSEHAASFLVERAARDETAWRARVEAMVEARDLDIATDWLSGVPAGTATEQVWRDLLAILAREGEAVWTDVPELEALVPRAEATGDAGVLAAVRYRLGQARFDAMDLQGARRELRASIALDPTWERRFEAALLDAQVTDRIGPMTEAKAAVEGLAEEARERGDGVREGRCALFRQAFASRGGRRPEGRSLGGILSRMPGMYLVVPFDLLGTADGPRGLPYGNASERQGRVGRLACRALRGDLSAPGESPRARHLLAEVAFAGSDGSYGDPLGHLAESVGLGDEHGELLAAVVATRLALASGDLRAARPLALRALHLATEREEVVFTVPSLVNLSAIAVHLRLPGALDHLDRAWTLCQNTTDPQLRASVANVLVPLLQSTPDPRVPRVLAETLDYADRYPDDDESAWVRPRMRKLAEDALAEARRQLHRARSARDEAAVKRWKTTERKLRAIVEA